MLLKFNNIHINKWVNRGSAVNVIVYAACVCAGGNIIYNTCGVYRHFEGQNNKSGHKCTTEWTNWATVNEDDSHTAMPLCHCANVYDVLHTYIPNNNILSRNSRTTARAYRLTIHATRIYNKKI